MITSTPTRTPGIAGEALNSLTLRYLRWRLDHIEADVESMKANLRLWEADAEARRVEIATLTR